MALQPLRPYGVSSGIAARKLEFTDILPNFATGRSVFLPENAAYEKPPIKNESSKLHIAVAACRLSVGDGRCGVPVALVRLHGQRACCRTYARAYACLLRGRAARCTGAERVMHLRPPFYRHPTLHCRVGRCSALQVCGVGAAPLPGRRAGSPACGSEIPQGAGGRSSGPDSAGSVPSCCGFEGSSGIGLERRKRGACNGAGALRRCFNR